MATLPDAEVDRGFIYVAWGERYLREAFDSATNLRKHMSDPIVLVTSEPVDEPNPFDSVIVTPFSATYRDKINMRLSPFEHTVFLDTDTWVLQSLDEVFQLLERFDIVYQPSAPSDHYRIEGMPMHAFYEPSAGFVAWRKNDRTTSFFDVWDREYTAQERENGDGAWDQRSMRAALWKTDVHISGLGPDWQLMSMEANIFMNSVKMVHGRGRDANAARRECNTKIGPRLYVPRLGFTTIWTMTPLDYLRLSAASAYMFVYRTARMLLHWTGLWRLPTNKRPM